MFNMYPFAVYGTMLGEKGPCSVGLMTPRKRPEFWIFSLNDNVSELSSQRLTFEFCVLLQTHVCFDYKHMYPVFRIFKVHPSMFTNDKLTKQLLSRTI